MSKIKFKNAQKEKCKLKNIFKLICCYNQIANNLFAKFYHCQDIPEFISAAILSLSALLNTHLKAEFNFILLHTFHL